MGIPRLVLDPAQKKVRWELDTLAIFVETKGKTEIAVQKCLGGGQN